MTLSWDQSSENLIRIFVCKIKPQIAIQYCGTQLRFISLPSQRHISCKRASVQSSYCKAKKLTKYSWTWDLRLLLSEFLPDVEQLISLHQAHFIRVIPCQMSKWLHQVLGISMTYGTLVVLTAKLGMQKNFLKNSHCLYSYDHIKKCHFYSLCFNKYA